MDGCGSVLPAAVILATSLRLAIRMTEAPPALDGVRHEFPTVDGIRLHVALAGPESAPPLLLVHGWPQHWWTWRELVPRLAGTHRLIVPDLPGFGWSEAP